MNATHLRSKEFWIKEVKQINLADILRVTAMLLILVSAWYYQDPIKNPCDYCALIMNGETITCREQFMSMIETRRALSQNEETLTINFSDYFVAENITIRGSE